MSARAHLMPWSACSDTDQRAMRAEALGEQIVELSAHIAAAEARWLELIARFDEEELWACHGARSCAEASACRWAGERMDYGIAVDGLVRHRDRARQRASIRSC
ncbi:MAG TPA: hypothetical protein VF339_13215 [Gammaproteobacteria bacterium]